MWPMRSVAQPIGNSESQGEPERSKAWSQNRDRCANGKANGHVPTPPEEACTPCWARQRTPSTLSRESKETANSTLKQNCHLDRSVAQRRDLCVDAPSWKCFSTKVA